MQKEMTEKYKNLSIQELINLANGGDSEAMIRVGAYYLSLDPDLDINGEKPKKIARDWMEKAALAGHAGGIPVICSTYDAIVQFSEIAHGPTDRSVIDSKRECYKWYQLGYKLYMNRAPGFEAIKDFQDFKSSMELARYKLACSIFISGSFDEAQKYVSGHNDIPSQIMNVLADYFKITDRIGNKNNMGESIDESEENEYTAVIQRFKILFNDEYSVKPKDPNEEIIYSMAGKMLASHYAEVDKDLGMAFDVLNYIRSNLKNERTFFLIDEELSHFRKNNNGDLI